MSGEQEKPVILWCFLFNIVRHMCRHKCWRWRLCHYWPNRALY